MNLQIITDNMNKQNSIGLENQLSTEINDSKSYSSRFKQLKAIKSNSRCRPTDILPYRQEKAAITIQRFWRLRTLIKQKLYQSLRDQLDSYNEVLQYENATLDNLMKIYQNECQLLEESHAQKAKMSVRGVEEEANAYIKKMVSLTFKMQKKMVNEQQMLSISQQFEYWKQKIAGMSDEKQYLKDKLCGQLQQQEQQYLRRIKDQNYNLLQASKNKNDCEKMMREKLIETCKTQLRL